jgi:hypothetical protein
MKTYDRVHEQIIKEKKRIDNAIVQNQEFRKKCVDALKLCQLQIQLAMKGSV